jgi:hypothetical protein
MCVEDCIIRFVGSGVFPFNERSSHRRPSRRSKRVKAFKPMLSNVDSNVTESYLIVALNPSKPKVSIVALNLNKPTLTCIN